MAETRRSPGDRIERMPDLRPGLLVEVRDEDGALALLGRVAGCKSGRVVVEDAAGGDMPPAIYGRKVELVCFQSGKVFIVFGTVCGSTENAWVLDRLQSVAVDEKRTFFRLRFRPPVAARCARLPGGRSEFCQLLDISGGGACVKIQTDYRAGDRLRLTDVCVAQGTDPFSLACVVRRALPGEEKRYSCQFEAVPPREQDRLVQAIFTAQRDMLREQRERSRVWGGKR